MDDRSKKLAFLQMLRAFVEAVKAGGDLGAPAGVLYAAVLDKVSLEQFSTIMSALVAAGKVRKSGQRYFYVADL